MKHYDLVEKVVNFLEMLSYMKLYDLAENVVAMLSYMKPRDLVEKVEDLCTNALK